MLALVALVLGMGAAPAGVAAEGTGAPAAPLPQYAEQMHLGVGTCASSVCHGSATERGATDVLQNEYVTWLRYDSHAGAYDLLTNEESRAMARKLGLPNAHEADICLDCHAHNVPEPYRGEEFDITDGVTCEACHGPAQDWIASHTAQGATHAENLAAGMYPTDDIEARAELCLSCHLGTEDKFATHRIMGAGHPRLAFELSTFGALQPPHWALDADYAERKGVEGEFRIWLEGLVTAARHNVDLLQGPLVHQSGLFPDVALFDCHSCHHPMSDQRWAPTPATAGLEPGAIRINDANFVLLLPVAEVLDPDLHQVLLTELRRLHASVAQGSDALRQAGRRLDGVLQRFEATAARAALDDRAKAQVLEEILASAAAGHYRDYAAAEQATMAMDMLLLTLERADAHREGIDAVFDTVADDESYRPARFARAARALQRSLQAG